MLYHYGPGGTLDTSDQFPRKNVNEFPDYSHSQSRLSPDILASFNNGGSSSRPSTGGALSHVGSVAKVLKTNAPLRCKFSCSV